MGRAGPPSQGMFVSAAGTEAGWDRGQHDPRRLGPACTPAGAPRPGMVRASRRASAAVSPSEPARRAPGLETASPRLALWYGPARPALGGGSGLGLAPPPRRAQWWLPRRIPLPVAAAAGGR